MTLPVRISNTLAHPARAVIAVVRNLRRDDRGFICSTEAVLFGTILLIGSLVGLVTLRDHVVQELGDVGAALGNLNHSYNVEGFRTERCGQDCYVAGSAFTDKSDFCELGHRDGSDNGDRPGQPPGCINISGREK